MPKILLSTSEDYYHRLVDSAFQTQLGRNLEAYEDDMVIERKTEQEMIMDIVETFDNLRRALPFFETLNNITKENKDDYQWMEEVERALQEMKKLILELLMLTTLALKEV
ncbi:hypothetical protein Tco_1452980, partial [Tanacetum coccineum]